METYTFNDLIKTVETLLGENGCPWDRAQTFESLREDLLEECNEAIEAVDKNDPAAICEELGDVVLTILLYAKIAEKESLFTLSDIINGLTQKLIRRHSHVFGDKKALTPEEALLNWEIEKKKEKGILKLNTD